MATTLVEELVERRKKLIRISVYAENLGVGKICGKCPNPFPERNGKKTPENRGCCTHCADSGAYFGISKDITKLKKQYSWSDVFGFWSDKGCKLPREERSDICLRYYCGTAYNFSGMKILDRALRTVW